MEISISFKITVILNFAIIARHYHKQSVCLVRVFLYHSSLQTSDISVRASDFASSSRCYCDSNCCVAQAMLIRVNVHRQLVLINMRN